MTKNSSNKEILETINQANKGDRIRIRTGKRTWNLKVTGKVTGRTGNVLRVWAVHQDGKLGKAYNLNGNSGKLQGIRKTREDGTRKYGWNVTAATITYTQPEWIAELHEAAPQRAMTRRAIRNANRFSRAA